MAARGETDFRRDARTADVGRFRTAKNPGRVCSHRGFCHFFISRLNASVVEQPPAFSDSIRAIISASSIMRKFILYDLYVFLLYRALTAVLVCVLRFFFSSVLFHLRDYANNINHIQPVSIIIFHLAGIIQHNVVHIVQVVNIFIRVPQFF